jgi:hypothetical protein
MVDSETIKTNFDKLLELVKAEAEMNSLILDFYTYLNSYTPKFSDESNILIKDELKLFLRGANRYSDEFVFSEMNYSEIRNIINRLYDLL